MNFPNLAFEGLAAGAEDSLKQYGVAVINGVDQKAVDALYVATRQFFAADKKTKSLYDRSRFGIEGWGYNYDRNGPRSGRESFEMGLSIDFTEYGFEENIWPTVKIFPELNPAFSRVYDQFGPLADSVGCGQAFLEVFRYFAARNFFKITPHQDDVFVVGLRPIGEPLGVSIEDKWYYPELSYGQAILLAPGIKHAVLNKTKEERLAATISVPVTPL